MTLTRPGWAWLAPGPRFLTLRPPDFELDADELNRLVTPATKAIVVNTPHNPSGKVFDRDDLDVIADVCQSARSRCHL